MVVKTTAKLISKKELSEKVSHFVFEAKEQFEFKEGQFVNFIVQDRNDKPIRRAYSIASSFNSKNPNEFELCIKLEEEGQLTPKLFNAKEGDEFNIMGPLGLFKLKNIEHSRDSREANQVFIAAGTGIAPMRSFIQYLLETRNYTSQVTLLFGARNENEILFKEEFEELQRKYPQFNFIITLSRPSSNWEGLRGYIQDNLSKINVVDTSQIYICGRNAMVDSVHEVLDSFEIAKENRSHEKFG